MIVGKKWLRLLLIDIKIYCIYLYIICYLFFHDYTVLGNELSNNCVLFISTYISDKNRLVKRYIVTSLGIFLDMIYDIRY